MIDLEPTKLYNIESRKRKASPLGEYQGIPLAATDVPKQNMRHPDLFRKQHEAAILRHKTPPPTEEGVDPLVQPVSQGNDVIQEANEASVQPAYDLSEFHPNTSQHLFAHTPVGRRFNELRVKNKLLPSIILLSHPDNFNEAEMREAADYARSARRLAKKLNASQGIQARCAYYVGLAEFLLAAASDELSRPGSSSSADSWRDRAMRPLQYFQAATGAKGMYAEGTWAEEWVQYLVDRSKRDSDQRPGSSESWLGKVWGTLALWRTNKSVESSADGAESKRESWTSNARVQDENADSPEAIPSSSTSSACSDSGNDRYPNNVLGGNISIQDFTRPRAGRKRLVFSAPSAAEEEVEAERPGEPLLPVYHTPQTSPTKSTASTSPRSVTFSSEANEQGGNGDGAGGNSIYHRRNRSSLSSIIARRGRRPSEVEQMEEGNSPYMAGFDEVVSKKLD